MSLSSVSEKKNNMKATDPKFCHFGFQTYKMTHKIKFHMPTQKISIVHKKAYENNLKNITELLQFIKSGILAFCMLMCAYKNDPCFENGRHFCV